MSNKKNKESFIVAPIERHDTAAWQNTDKHKSVSGVIIPSEDDSVNAKEYVDTNQK